MVIYGGKSKHPLIEQVAWALFGFAAIGGGLWLLVGIFIADLPAWTALVGVPPGLVGLVLALQTLGLTPKIPASRETVTGPVIIRTESWDHTDYYATVHEIEFSISVAVYRSL